MASQGDGRRKAGIGKGHLMTRSPETRTSLNWRALAILGMALAGCDESTLAPSDTSGLFINEFMAENDTTIQDPDGTGYPDWIEIYNADTNSVNLGGMYLTDDLANPTKWRIPDGVTIPANGYLLFWADNDTEQGEIHTNFKLAVEGEEIGLFDTAENGYATIDTVTFGRQTSDVSFGRQPGGADTWRTFSSPTPGQPNQ